MSIIRFRGCVITLFIFSLWLSSVASAQQTIDADILQRITKAKTELNNLQRNISGKSQAYAQKLDQRENEITSLRTQVAAQQRLADEQLLSLDKLKERVDQWEARSNYQSQMLRHFGDAAGLSGELQNQEDPLAVIVQHFESTLAPTWKPVKVILPGGTVAESPTLKMGPVEVTLDQETQLAGLLVREQGLEPQVLDLWGAEEKSNFLQLRESGYGYFTFDPTLGNALQLRGSGNGIADHLKKGGIWAVPIVFFGILSLLIAVLKGVQLLRLPKVNDAMLEQVKNGARPSHAITDLPVEARKAYENAGAAQRKLIQIALNNPVSQQRDDLMVANLMENKHVLEKYMGIVAISAAVAPLLGLLGTVSGMIDTFKMMTIFGSGDASTVSGGISEALITTELGLIVAIPSLLVSALLTRQIKHYMHRLENFAIRLSKVSFG